MNKMTEVLANKFGVPRYVEPPYSPLTFTHWFYVVEVRPSVAMLVTSREDAATYAKAKEARGQGLKLRFPNYITVPTKSIRLVQEGSHPGAVLLTLPLALALEKRLIRGVFPKADKASPRKMKEAA